MRNIRYNDQDFDFDSLRDAMDPDLTKTIEGTTSTDQEFFDSYLIAHSKKHGQEFTVS